MKTYKPPGQPSRPLGHITREMALDIAVAAYWRKRLERIAELRRQAR